MDTRRLTRTEKRLVLFATVCASFLTPFMGSSINIALPSIAAEFGTDAVMLGWIQTAYLLTAAVIVIPVGRFADIHGLKKLFIAGVSVFSLTSLLCSLSWSTGSLIFFRVLEGLGDAMMYGTAVAMITMVFPPGERGRALGINVAAVYIGLSLGPVIGGVLTFHAGWRSIFMLVVPLGMAVAALTWLRVPHEWAGARGETYDLMGALLYCAMLCALLLGLTTVPATEAIWLIAGGLVVMVPFVRRELRVPHPVFNVRLFARNTVFACSNIAALINYSATFAIAYLLSLYLQYNRGFDPLMAGLILVAQPVLQAIFSPPAGALSDRIEPRIVASIGMGLNASGLFLLSFVQEATPLWMIIGVLALLGIGFALFSSPNTNAVMTSVTKAHYGIASATVATMRLIGQTTSMACAMVVFAVLIGRVQIGPAQHAGLLASMQALFLIFGILCTVGVFISLARGKVKWDGPRDQKSSGPPGNEKTGGSRTDQDR
ncbi:MAG: MFS transporter [Methanomicrobiales archaeon]